MFVRMLIATIASAIVMFVWGFIVWGISPIPTQFIQAIPQQEAIGKQLNQQLPESGVYFLPFLEAASDQETQERLMEAHREGPIAQIHILKEGAEPMSPKTMGMGFLHNAVAAFLMACLLKAAVGSLKGFTSRFGFVILVGIFAAVYTHGIDLVWFYQPVDYSLFRMGYNVTTWVLAAPILALLITPPKPNED